MTRLFGNHVVGMRVLGLPFHVAAFDFVAHAGFAIGAELEGLVVREVFVPVFEQEVVIGEKGIPPLDHSIVYVPGERGFDVGHI